MVITYCKRCHSPIAMGTESGMCEPCARLIVEEAVAEASAAHLRQLAEIYGEPPVFCRIVDPKGTQTGRQLRAFRDRNRLYCRSVVVVAGVQTLGPMFRVPPSWGSSDMLRRMRGGRLYLLTNGMH
ncbi:hypothetical protein [Phage ST231]|nr:hypothetical protein [Phage ST231]